MLKLNNCHSLDRINLIPTILFEICKQSVFLIFLFLKLKEIQEILTAQCVREYHVFLVSCFCHTSVSSLHHRPFLTFYLISVGGACSVLCICFHVQLNGPVGGDEGVSASCVSALEPDCQTPDPGSTTF